MACASGKKCAAHAFELRQRHKSNQFEQFVALRHKHTHILQSQFLRHAKIDTAVGTVHAGVRGVDGDVVSDGLHHAAFHLVAFGERFQPFENQRVMRNYQVVTKPHRLVDNRFGHIEAKQRASNFGIAPPNEQSAVVETLLQSQWRKGLDSIDDLL